MTEPRPESMSALQWIECWCHTGYLCMAQYTQLCWCCLLATSLYACLSVFWSWQPHPFLRHSCNIQKNERALTHVYCLNSKDHLSGLFETWHECRRVKAKSESENHCHVQMGRQSHCASVFLFSSKADYDRCDFAEATKLGDKSLATYIVKSAGVNYFSCSVSSHCKTKQKLTLIVTGTASHAHHM